MINNIARCCQALKTNSKSDVTFTSPRIASSTFRLEEENVERLKAKTWAVKDKGLPLFA